MQKSLRLAPLLALSILAGSSATAQSLSQARQSSAATTINDVALFAGGRFAGAGSSVVDAYDSATDTWSVASLTSARNELAATVIGNFAMFAGGATSPSTSSDVIDIYDASVGPPSQASAWSVWTLSEPRFGLAATTCGTMAFFAGGGLGGPASVTGVSDVVDIYDSSMGAPNDPAAWSTASLSVPRGKIAAAAAGNQAVFAGGLTATGASDTVDIYDCTTGLWTMYTLPVARLIGEQGSATVGTRVYFGGGQTGPMASNVSDRIDVYDTESGTWSMETLPVARAVLAATAVGHTVIFAGGGNASGPSSDVDQLNVITGEWDSTASLSVARFNLCATSVGNRALVAGGGIGGAVTAVVDVFEPYVGANYCGSAALNSTGVAAVLEASGSPLASANDVSLLASSMPASANGFFLASQTQGFTANPGGSVGNLCLDGAIGRYVGAGQVKNSGADGYFELTLDLNLMPTPTGLIAAQAGQTWNFQAWHRDTIGGVSVSNFTNALSLTLL